MNPFDLPPTTPPVSVDPPPPGPVGSTDPGRGPGRGRTALVALAAAGLVGAGLVGVGQLASADRPSVDATATATAPDGDTEPIDPVDPADDGEGDPSGPSVEGEIVIDDGTGDRVVIDLGEGTIDGRSFESIAECLGLPAFADGPWFDGEGFPLDEFELPLDDFDLGELEDLPFGDFGMLAPDGTHITVLGPDGVQIVELGEGDGSVTITQQDGEVTISTDGGATVQELPDVLGEFGDGAWTELVPGDIDPEQLLEEFFGEGAFDDEFFQELPSFDEMFDDLPGGFETIDPAEIEACLEGADG